jgi:hypothetical protein
VPTLEDLREILLREHSECRRVQAGGRPRMLPIAQVLCDWTSPAGQRVIGEYEAAQRDPAALERYLATRERIAQRDAKRRGELEARAWVGARRRVGSRGRGRAVGRRREEIGRMTRIDPRARGPPCREALT